MKNYERILVGVELNPDCDDQVINRALEFAKEFNSLITTIHVVEHMSSYGAAYGIAAGTDVEQILVDSAKQEITKLGNRYNVPATQQLIKIGSAKAVILDEAERLKADLIVLGSHGRHGIRLLLGSTANAVLHGAKCDVLAVRVKSPDK
ncbi:MAG: universal stress protein [Gammaproteobacteria bacterium]